ncbi:MAG: hypothetical protein LBQ02_04560 [Candidatus Nomurabacteria bacterium]|jgi:hypothetical protein|nr:hypothetical protein [Candidatus Nomurabacteria bacterium]
MHSNFIKNLIMHIKYPYTAAIIAVMWVGVAIIVSVQNTNNMEVLISITALGSLIIANIGFKSPK